MSNEMRSVPTLPEQTAPATGTFCWNELATSDREAAKRFYTELFGWTPSEAQFGPTTYTTFKSGARAIAGMMQMSPECGETPPHWMAYVAVDDVDEIVRRVWELGGRICVPPTDIPSVGRFSVINDPTGATLSIIKLNAS